MDFFISHHDFPRQKKMLNLDIFWLYDEKHRYPLIKNIPQLSWYLNIRKIILTVGAIISHPAQIMPRGEEIGRNEIY